MLKKSSSFNTSIRFLTNNADISDVNECESDICSHGCVDTIDSYYCTCDPGYTLISDRHHCRGMSRNIFMIIYLLVLLIDLACRLVMLGDTLAIC